MLQQQGTSVLQHTDKASQHFNEQTASNTRQSDIQPVISESQLPLPRQNFQPKEREHLVASANIVGLTEEGKVAASSLPSTKSNVAELSRQPQSFPDRLALIQRKKQMEDSRVFARSCVRALKVSTEFILTCCTCGAAVVCVFIYKPD